MPFLRILYRLWCVCCAVPVVNGELTHIFESIQNAVSPQLPVPSPFAYDPAQHESDAPSRLPLPARQFMLSVLEVLPSCMVITTMQKTWRFQLNRDIADLVPEFRKLVPRRVRFACSRWINLLCEAGCADDAVMTAVLKPMWVLRYWIAAMGIMGRLGQACQGLRRLYMWLVRRFIAT